MRNMHDLFGTRICGRCAERRKRAVVLAEMLKMWYIIYMICNACFIVFSDGGYA